MQEPAVAVAVAAVVVVVAVAGAVGDPLPPLRLELGE